MGDEDRWWVMKKFLVVCVCVQSYMFKGKKGSISDTFITKFHLN